GKSRPRAASEAEARRGWCTVNEDLLQPRCSAVQPGPRPGSNQALKPQFTQSRMIGGTRPLRPVELAVAVLDGQVVDAGMAHRHLPVFRKLPVFISIGAIPLPRIIPPFVGKAHGNTVVGKAPDFLD